MPLLAPRLHMSSVVRTLLLPLLLLLVLAPLLLMWWEGRTPERTSSAYAAGPGSSPDLRPGGGSRRAGNGAVAALGHIEPQDGVLLVTADYFEGHPQRVRELNVKQGDQVRAGQLLAVLDGKEQIEKAVQLAEARVDLARVKLAQVKAGASQSDIAAQVAEVNQLQASLDNARAEYQRYEQLHEKTDVSTAELDARKLTVRTSERKLEEAEERLKSISEVRQTDVDVAESELRVAMAEAARERAKLRTALVYSPVTGRVLKIHAHAGEEAGPQGLLDLGKTDSMYVEADVYETDVARVRPGQRASITSDLFSGELSGVVEIVGTTIAKNEVLPLDPVAFADARVFKVRIRLDDGGPVEGLIHGKVNVVIQP